LLFVLLDTLFTPESYTLSLHDALPISRPASDLSRFTIAIKPSACLDRELKELRFPCAASMRFWQRNASCRAHVSSNCAYSLCAADRKSTRLNSSHGSISYAVFCLKKKK